MGFNRFGAAIALGAAVAVLGACSDETPTAPTSVGAIPRPSFAVGDAVSPGPVTGEFRVCKNGANGTFTVTPGAGEAGNVTVQSPLNVAAGECRTAAVALNAAGAHITVTETTPGCSSISVSAIGFAARSSACPSATDFVNAAFHGVTATFTNTVAPPPPVVGCTFTQGRWKNKNAPLIAGMLAGDPNHAGITVAGQLLVANGSFTVGGVTFDGTLTSSQIAQIFGMPPRGDAAIILLHQLMAAELNILNGAGTTPAILTDIANAQALLVGGISNAERAQATAIADRLDAYNNGLAPGGPPHCGDEVVTPHV